MVLTLVSVNGEYETWRSTPPGFCAVPGPVPDGFSKSDMKRSVELLTRSASGAGPRASSEASPGARSYSFL